VLAFFVDDSIFFVVEADFFDQADKIVLMRAGGCVVGVFGDAGGQLDDDLVFFNALFLFQCALQQGQLSVQGAAAASTAGEADHADWFVGGVVGETAGALVEGLFTQIARAAFFDDMALNDDEIFFLAKIHGLLQKLEIFIHRE